MFINPVERLYNIELDKYYFAAAAHTKPVIDYINKIRLKIDSNKYYNSGVMLINAALLERSGYLAYTWLYPGTCQRTDITPDQDVLNGGFSGTKLNPWMSICIITMPSGIVHTLIASKGRVNMDYVIYNTVILHFLW